MKSNKKVEVKEKLEEEIKSLEIQREIIKREINSLNNQNSMKQGKQYLNKNFYKFNKNQGTNVKSKIEEQVKNNKMAIVKLNVLIIRKKKMNLGNFQTNHHWIILN